MICRKNTYYLYIYRFLQKIGSPHRTVVTSPVLGQHRNTYNLTWTTRAFAPILEMEIRFRLARVRNDAFLFIYLLFILW